MRRILATHDGNGNNRTNGSGRTAPCLGGGSGAEPPSVWFVAATLKLTVGTRTTYRRHDVGVLAATHVEAIEVAIAGWRGDGIELATDYVRTTSPGRRRQWWRVQPGLLGYNFIRVRAREVEQ